MRLKTKLSSYKFRIDSDGPLGPIMHFLFLWNSNNNNNNNNNIFIYTTNIYIYIFIYITDVLRVSGGPAYLFGHPFFQMYFNKKYAEVVITDFTKHLMISKWLRRQKC